MGKIFRKLQPLPVTSASVAPVEKFVSNLIVLFGNNCAEVVETNFILGDSLVKELWAILLDNFF